MIGINKNVYLETSAVNFFADRLTPSDAIATKIYHQVRATRFYISPITIWEILLTNDDGRREMLVYFLQRFGHENLLNSPAEFIFNFINADSPLIEPKYEPHSRQPLAQVWKDITSDTRKTFIFEKRQFSEIAKSMRQGFKMACRLTEEAGITNVVVDQVTNSKLSLDAVLRQMKTVEYSSLTAEDKRRYKLSIMFMAIVLCYGTGLEEPCLDQFWGNKNVKSTTEKLSYLISEHESLIYKGPIAVMSRMAQLQLGENGKLTRGILWDALHSLYLCYTDLFLTTDQHFKMLRETEHHPIYKRIIFLPDTGIFTAKEMDLI
jgi:hypothetical protein